MPFLDVDRACTVLRLKGSDASGHSLLEQVRPMLEHVPNIILDMDGIRLTSMAIGELTNLAQAFHRHWDDQPHSLVMTNLDATGRKSLAVIHFDQVIPVIDDQRACLDVLFGDTSRERATP